MAARAAKPIGQVSCREPQTWPSTEHLRGHNVNSSAVANAWSQTYSASHAHIASTVIVIDRLQERCLRQQAHSIHLCDRILEELRIRGCTSAVAKVHSFLEKGVSHSIYQLYLYLSESFSYRTNLFVSNFCCTSQRATVLWHCPVRRGPAYRN